MLKKEKEKNTFYMNSINTTSSFGMDVRGKSFPTSLSDLQLLVGRSV